MVISFVRDGLAEWAERNIDAENVVLLLDESREVYRLFGLSIGSTWAVWQPKVMWYYLKRTVSGKSLDSPNGDTLQLGGDFVVAQDGSLRLSYPSQDPTDRPTLEMIQNALI